jgi:hypothetical protein
MPSIRELWGWYTTGQAAHHAGMSRQTVVDLAREGKVRAVYVGGEHDHGRGTWIYDPESIEAYRQHRIERERRAGKLIAELDQGEE